jgi:hypothetical protein
MPTMNYKKYFVQAILDGKKVHTLRFSKRAVRKGQLLYCQTGSRFKPNRFAVLPAMRVRDIVLTRDMIEVWSEDSKLCCIPPRNQFAQADGFRDWAELRDWFDATYGANRKAMYGKLVQWAEAPWETVRSAEAK